MFANDDDTTPFSDASDVFTQAVAVTGLLPGPDANDRLYPDFLNGMVIYGFPAIFGLGIIANTLSFIVIQLSEIRATSTGVYLSVLACSDIVCLTLWASLLWAIPVLGRSFPGLHMCNVSQFGVALFSSLSAMLIVCVTTDRFIAVWFPFRAKELTTRVRALCVIIALTLCLLALFLPVLFSFTDKCVVIESLKLYGNTAMYILLNITYSYGVIIYLCGTNMGIVYRLCKAQRLSEDSRMPENKKSFQAATIVLSVSAAYIICTVPPNILISLKSNNIVTFDNRYVDEVVFTFGRSLIFVNHTINFFLYILTSSNFRKTFVALFSGSLRRNTSVTGNLSLSTGH